MSELLTCVGRTTKLKFFTPVMFCFSFFGGWGANFFDYVSKILAVYFINFETQVGNLNFMMFAEISTQLLKFVWIHLPLYKV